jgi:hypothetical protein
VSVEPEPDEGTRLQTVQPPRPAAVRERTVLPAFAVPRTPTIPQQPAPAVMQPLAQQLPAAYAPASAPAAVAGAMTRPPQEGMARRFFRGLWNFTVTTAVMALFVGAWALAANGVMQGRKDQVYAGAAASVLFTPLAVHRLTGRRGRYGFVLFGSIIATATAVYYVGRDTSFVMARLTRRRLVAPPYVGY